EPHDHRSRSGGRHEVIRLSRVLLVTSVTSVLALLSGVAVAQERPTVGPEKPFQLTPRVERTLPNGLRVSVAKQPVVPKVTMQLPVPAGYTSDPADQTGLAQMTSEIVQEGTKTRTSKEIRRDAFAMGGSLSSAVSQDYTALTVRGLS